MTLGDFLRCAICGDHGFFGGKHSNHRCKPSWECRIEWHSDDPDAWQLVYATDAEEAVEKYAEDYDCNGGEYAIVGSNKDIFIQVRVPKDPDAETDPEFERWAVEGETVPRYRASKAA